MANEFKKITELDRATAVSDTDLFIVETNLGTKSVDIGTFRGEAATKESVGLGNVDNTSDIDKPISTAMQAELDKKLEANALTGLISEDTAKYLFPTKAFVAESYLDKATASTVYLSKTDADTSYATKEELDNALLGIEELLAEV